MSRLYNNIVELIGNTPLVKLNKLNDGFADIYVKLEYFNPANSIKDRAALSMIDVAEKALAALEIAEFTTLDAQNDVKDYAIRN